MTTSTLSSTNQLPDGPPGKASTGGLVGWSLHHRTIAIGGWVLLVLLCVLGGNLTGTSRPPRSSSRPARRDEQRRWSPPPGSRAAMSSLC